MARPFDVSKFKKGITKSIAGISTGFRDPDTWIDTGSYALNYLISGDFYKGVPLGKVTVFAGRSGAGKSYIVSGNIVKDAQKQGIFVVLIDSENALDEKWLGNLGVDTSEEKILKINAAMIDDVAKIISDFVIDYRKEYGNMSNDERPKVLFVVDSLGMLMSPTDRDHFESGQMKGDMGRKAKQLKSLVTNCVNMFGDLNIGLVATNHSYASQNMFDLTDVVSGGSGFVYASSILVLMDKLKLKEDEDGNKISDVKGIRAVCKVEKTRYNKPFESVKVNIPYEGGMSPISGLFDMFEKRGVLAKVGNRYKYVSKTTGEEMVYFRKEWNDYEKLKVIMDEFSDHQDTQTESMDLDGYGDEDDSQE